MEEDALRVVIEHHGISGGVGLAAKLGTINRALLREFRDKIPLDALEDAKWYAWLRAIMRHRDGSGDEGHGDVVVSPLLTADYRGVAPNHFVLDLFEMAQPSIGGTFTILAFVNPDGLVDTLHIRGMCFGTPLKIDAAREDVIGSVIRTLARRIPMRMRMFKKKLIGEYLAFVIYGLALGLSNVAGIRGYLAGSQLDPAAFPRASRAMADVAIVSNDEDEYVGIKECIEQALEDDCRELVAQRDFGMLIDLLKRTPRETMKSAKAYLEIHKESGCMRNNR